MQKDKQYYDDFFTKYPVNVHDNSARFLAVSKLLKGKVLDVACGTGTLADYYSGDYVGVDISDVAISKAIKARRKNALFTAVDFTKPLNLEISKFDTIYIGEFLEHIENDEVVFDNVLHFLNPYGRIVVSVPNGDRIPDESHCRTFTVPQIRRDYSKYGKITFHNWSGFAGRILFTIDIAEKNQKNMSLVMIVKDEEKGIEKAILSALPIVDQVIIAVDTATTDKTAAIAKLYADELRFYDWHDDFSRARNEAAENVKTKWILFLDGHEYIKNYGNIEEKMKSNVEGIFVTIKMESGLTFLYPRIYRRGLKFVNKVHNLITCKTRRCEPDFLIIHDRLSGQDEKSTSRRNRQREEMMPRILKDDLEDNPKNARSHFHLANFYMMREKVNEAMKHYKKAIKFGKSPDEKFLCLLHLGALHASKGHSLRALWNFQKADELEPNRWESARALGGFYLAEKHYKKAVDYFVNALTPNKRHYAYEPFEQDFAEIWDLIGHCFIKLNQNKQALIAFERALEVAKAENQQNLFRQKIKLVKMLVAEKT